MKPLLHIMRSLMCVEVIVWHVKVLTDIRSTAVGSECMRRPFFVVVD